MHYLGLETPCLFLLDGTVSDHHDKIAAQAQTRCRTVEKHLVGIAAVLKRERPDIVGLQEVDGHSCLSGNFDHVERLARDQR